MPSGSTGPVGIVKAASRRPSRAYPDQPTQSYSIPVVNKPHPPTTSFGSGANYPVQSQPTHSNGTSTIKALSSFFPFPLSWKRKSKLLVQDEQAVSLNLPAKDTQSSALEKQTSSATYSLSPAQRQRLRPSISSGANDASNNIMNPGVKVLDQSRVLDDKLSKPFHSSMKSPSSPSSPIVPQVSRQRSSNRVGVSSGSHNLLKNPRSAVPSRVNSGNLQTQSQSPYSSNNVSAKSSVVNSSENNVDELHHHYPNSQSRSNTGASSSSAITSKSSISSPSTIVSSSSVLRRKIQQVASVSEEFQMSPPRSTVSKSSLDIDTISKQHNHTLSKGGNTSTNSSLLSMFSHTSLSHVASSTVVVDNATATTVETSDSTEQVNVKKSPCCDKCDGKHETDDCPYYKKKREDHPDAQRNKGRQIGGTSLLPGGYITNARVIRQPGDGSCLFHSLSYGLGGSYSASRLRSEICSFIQANPQLLISETPLKEWVKWDSGSSVGDYVRKMSRSSWGGGIEMACFSQMKQVNVHVYERSGNGFKRISAFDVPVNAESRPVIKVLYGGGVHYDALA